MAIALTRSPLLEKVLTRLAVFAALSAMMLFAVALSVFFFSAQSLRLDEAQSLWQTSRSVPNILSTVARDVHVPLYHLLLHFWRIYFGNTVDVARAMSLFFYVLNIPAIYLLGRYAYNRSVGLFAALLLALSPFMNWYGSEIRMYTLFTLLAILNQYFFIRLYREHDDASWVGYTLTAIAGIFTHYFFFFNLVAQAAFFLLFRREFAHNAFRRFLAVAGIVAALFLPWAAYVFALGEAGNQQPVLPVPTSVNVFSTFAQFLFGFQNDHVNTFFLSIWPVAVLFGFLAMQRSRKGNRERSLETSYFTLAVIVSFGMALIISFLVHPIFVSRYLIFTIPSLYLLIVSLFSIYPPRLARLGSVALIAIMIAALAFEIASPTNPARENYREAAGYLSRHASAQDVIVLSSPFTVYPVDYYYRGPAPIETLPRWNRYTHGPIPAFNASTLPQDVDAIAKDHSYLWLLLSFDQGYLTEVKDYFDTHYERVLVKNFSPGLNVYVYKLRYDVPAPVGGIQFPRS